jgi:hypothetical protein
MPESGTSGSVGAAGKQLPAATRHDKKRPIPEVLFTDLNVWKARENGHSAEC